MIDRLAAFYSGKRVLITGHTGFKGAWLSLWLGELGANVYGYALPPTSPSLFDELRLADCLAGHRLGDARDMASLGQAIRDARPELVFHLAAQPLVRESYRIPLETYAVNVMGTVHLLEALRVEGSCRVIQVATTDKCYENSGRITAFREDDPLGGSDPYSSSKACAEMAVAAYRKSFFHNGPSLSSVRAGNVIGGGDWSADRIVPDCIRALENGKPVLVRNPGAVRPWQFVLEPLAGYLELACRQWDRADAFAEAWNFGPLPDAHATVQELVDGVIEHWGTGTAVRAAESVSEVPEAPVLRLEVTKSVTRLGWRPVYKVRQAVAETVAWYRQRGQQGSAFDARSLCLEQIRSYTLARRETA